MFEVWFPGFWWQCIEGELCRSVLLPSKQLVMSTNLAKQRLHSPKLAWAWGGKSKGGNNIF